MVKSKCFIHENQNAPVIILRRAKTASGQFPFEFVPESRRRPLHATLSILFIICLNRVFLVQNDIGTATLHREIAPVRKTKLREMMEMEKKEKFL
jgi:hypothetical protein